MSDDESVTQWLESLRREDCRADEAMERIWDRYSDRIVKYAGRHLLAGIRRQSDEDDVAQEAMHSFFRAAGNDQFDRLHDRQDLWRLLTTITIRKISAKVRRETAAKRGGGQVRGESIFVGDSAADAAGIDQYVLDRVTPELGAQVAEQVRLLIEAVEKERDGKRLRQIVELKLSGLSNQEISESVNVSERTVERKILRIRQIVAQWFDFPNLAS